jgi:hypothetical protein
LEEFDGYRAERTTFHGTASLGAAIEIIGNFKGGFHALQLAGFQSAVNAECSGVTVAAVPHGVSVNPDSEVGTTKVTKIEEIAGLRACHKRSWQENPANPLFFVKFRVFRGWNFCFRVKMGLCAGFGCALA